MRFMDKWLIVSVLVLFSVINIALDRTDISYMVSAIGLVTAIGFSLVKTKRDESNK